MIRTIKVSTKFATELKTRAVSLLLREYRSATNFYIDSIWSVPGKLDAATLKRRQGGSLGYRQKSDALAMALETVISTKRAAKATKRRCSKPTVNGAFRVSSLCAKIEPFKQPGFDYAVKLSGLVKGKPIVIPIKSHKRLNHWLSQPGAKLKQGCVLHKDWIGLYIEVPDLPVKTTGTKIGIDTGYKKLVSTSNGTFHGTDMVSICDRVRRKKPGSKAKRKTQAYRSNYINRAVKELPWQDLQTIAIEDLTGLKLRTQQKDKSSKQVRKTMAPWAYRQVLNRIELLAQENRVRLVFVDPRNTSRRCPTCGWVAKANRVAEKFRCVKCDYRNDADTVGALNILDRATGNWQESMVPVSSEEFGAVATNCHSSG